jgi:hypothetical protein
MPLLDHALVPLPVAHSCSLLRADLHIVSQMLYLGLCDEASPWHHGPPPNFRAGRYLLIPG